MSLQLGMLAFEGRQFVKNLYRDRHKPKRNAARLDRLERFPTVNQPNSLIL